MWERWKSELKSWEILCLVSTRGSGQEMGFVVREFSSHASQERSLDKNNEIISTLQASFSITDQFGGQFVQEFSPWSSSRIMHWISQKKSLRSGLVKILVSSIQLIFTRACYINYFDWLLSDIESVWLYSIILWNRDIFSQILFNKDCKSRFKARRNLFYRS